MIRRFHFALIAVAVTFMVLGPFVQSAEARKAYAQKEKKVCAYCHLNPAGGGARGFRGLYYASHKLSFAGFVEKKEAGLAGVKVGAMGPDTKPTKDYPPSK